jgi:hypothetical protein
LNPAIAFEELRAFLDRYDSLELLCQASMTYLFAPEGKFHSESDEIQIWARHIEFAAGYYATREADSAAKKPVTGWVLEEFKKLLDDYYSAVDLATFMEAKERRKKSFSLASARIHSMHVRGEAYPHQFEEYARELYGAHDKWFLSKLGFTISDAFSIAEAATSTMNDRYAQARAASAEEARNRIQSDRSWTETSMTEKEAERSAQCQFFYGRSKDHFRLKPQDLAEASGVSLDRCKAALARLSQKPPYRNPHFPNTFTNPQSAPWDYNTLSERPLLTDGESYWLVIPFLLKQNLYYTFYYDLMQDTEYMPIFEKARGRYLEQKVAECLRTVFPSSSVLLNPNYPNGNEFADVLVLHDGKILIVQCKGKILTRQAFIGADTQAVKSDIQKAVKDAIEQGVKCRKYLESSAKARLLFKGSALEIDMAAVTGIEIIAVTYMPLHTMATRIREVEQDLGMSHSEFRAWAISLGDLNIVTDVCDSPARLLHYIRRRLLIEKEEVRVHGDEMDLLGFYLSQGLCMKDERFENANLLAISGFSDKIDEYVFRRWGCKQDVEKPRVARPEGFDEVIKCIETLAQFHRTDCAITLLDLSGEGSKKFMEISIATKEKTAKDGLLHSASMQGTSDIPGISLITVSQKTPRSFLHQRTEAFGILKKYSGRHRQWVGLGSQQGSTKPIDIAVWLESDWVQNDVMDGVASELAQGVRIPFN